MFSVYCSVGCFHSGIGEQAVLLCRVVPAAGSVLLYSADCWYSVPVQKHCVVPDRSATGCFVPALQLVYFASGWMRW